jgi:hypothetical protein
MVREIQSDKDIEDEKLKVASDISWQREYLLRIIPRR